ncbi:MAG: GNAT family N-acetyltransferase [Gemmatimonadetes bacterium]|nr:GNAT family N-acetyltransferase [Gemmatimonadota bacterium]
MATLDEHELPCLYLLWPDHPLSEPSRGELPAGYVSRPYAAGDDAALRRLLELEGWAMTDEEWQDYKDRILPDGLFVIVHTGTGAVVATAGAVHNPNAGRGYFPFGGELAYLVVDPGHRGKRLGHHVSAMVVGRFISAGYRSIRVCVQGFRSAAIRTYLRLGFVPLLNTEEVRLRWRRIHEQVGWPFEPER